MVDTVKQSAASSHAAAPTAHGSPVIRRRGGTISRLVATFLRVLLLPVIFIGIPLWPVLGLLCAVPIIGIITIPLFILTTALLLYAVAWFSYLVLAQADPPASSQSGHLSLYLPFLPYSPIRCLKINWAAFLYATTAVRIAVPSVLDWSYRRVMVLGTQGGGGAIVRENIQYGSASHSKSLDIYLPPANDSSGQRTTSLDGSTRSRKHSTHFAEPGAHPRSPEVARDNQARAGEGPHPSSLAPVIVIVPSPIPPIMWTKHRKTYLQLALRLRRMGYCVVVPDITTYPEGRVDNSIVDLRLVLHWIAQNAHRYGGDERKIHLLGHGMSAHLVMLTLTQEVVVFSREGFLLDEEESSDAMQNGKSSGDATAAKDSARQGPAKEGDDAPRHTNGIERGGIPDRAQSSMPLGDSNAPDESTWVDEASEDDLPPGAVMTGNETLETFSTQRQPTTPSGRTSSIAFPGASQKSVISPRRRGAAKGNDGAGEQGLESSSISNGLRRVAIYGPEIEVPPVAGVILLAGIFDVIKCFRKESDRGVEHLSVLRRTCGPSHTLCLLHSPAHLLYAAKNVIDTSLFPSKFLLIHGGKDAVVDISQSTLLKTLLSGIGLNNVRLRAYRELGHVEALASLFLGMGKSSTRYSKQILQDVSDFIAT